MEKIGSTSSKQFQKEREEEIKENLRVTFLAARVASRYMKPPVFEDIRPLQQQQQEETSTLGANNTTSSSGLQQNLPCRDLLMGSREDYLKIGVPLYEASIKCNWNAAEVILNKKKELVRFSITENGETALHIAVSAKVPQKVAEVFVKNLVDLMDKEDLALVNENFNTALYLAVVAGKLETVKIMVRKNRDLLKIPGAKQQMLPLYVAALFGHCDLAWYLYENSNHLCDAHGWAERNRGWLLEKCIENDMFDIALEIVKRYPKLGSRNIVLAILARKPEEFHETQLEHSTNQPSENKHTEPGSGSVPVENLNHKPEASSKKSSNILWRTINSVFTFSGSKVKEPKNKRNALQLLRIIWEDIAKKPKNEIDDILRGPQDSNKHDKSAPGRVVQVMQLLISDHIYRVGDIIRRQTNTSQINNLISESLVRMHVETQNIVKGALDSIKEDNKPISGKADQALELQKLIFENIVNTHNEIQTINKITVEENQEVIQLQRLQEVISDHIGKMKTESQNIIGRPERKTYSSRVLFVAAKMGNTKFLVELIRQYPDLIWQVNDKNQTIFHIAVRYRHVDIYNLLYEIGAMKDLITPHRDPKQNNMLHLVGMSTKTKQLEDFSGVALQMRRELLWFQEVENMIPPSHRHQKNKDGLTPRELFTKEHQELVSEGEKWVKKIAAQCIVVAALIATMVFAAAFTVPGGYDQINGIPIFHSKLSFQIFVVADAISLFLSTASILHLFLSVFLSPSHSSYAKDYFLISLPAKLSVGITYLFVSIASMLIAFCAGFFVLYHKGLLWMPILISIFALLPFFRSVKLHFFASLILVVTTSSSNHIFNRKKHVLYYENPKV